MYQSLKIILFFILKIFNLYIYYKIIINIIEKHKELNVLLLLQNN